MSLFENDVKKYGTQTTISTVSWIFAFENDVKKYGTQTSTHMLSRPFKFENDVKKYGTQTPSHLSISFALFEKLRSKGFTYPQIHRWDLDCP